MAQKYANVYAEENAVPASDSRQAVENTGALMRMFKTDIPVGEWDAVIQEMWATRFFVDNPQIDRRAGGNDLTYKAQGRWRVANIRKSAIGEPPGIYEELRLGWLQPPGTVGDFPKSAGKNDWPGIDSQARVVKVVEFDADNRAIAGENRYYVLMIPGVATATVKEFCAALASRPLLANPKFGLQTPISGTWAIRGVRNEEQGDGSSVVMATLADAGGFTPGGLTMNDNWNETVVHQFYKHLPIYPAAPFPPVNVYALDDYPIDITGNKAHKIPAVIYQIVGAEFDGVWNITVVKRTAKPSAVQWSLPNRDSPYTILLFWNQTKLWTDTVGAGLSSNNGNGFQPRRNEFNLYDGHFHITFGSVDIWDTGSEDLVSFQTHEFTDHEGTHWLYRDTIHYALRSGFIIKSGEEFFSGGHESGQIHVDRHNDSWNFKRVTQIERNVYTIGAVSGATGLWTPATPSPVGSAFDIFKAKNIPWGP